MRRPHHTLLATLAVGIALAVTSPALAQIDPREMSSLERQRDDLTVELGEFDAQLETVEKEIAEVEDEIGSQKTELELLADDIEWTVFTRQEPAATRLEIAIVGFTAGDPRQNQLLNEVMTLEGDDEPSRRRALYESVIDDTEDRLAVIDTRLNELSDQLSTVRDRLAERQSILETAQERRDEIGAQRSEVATKLADVNRRIDDLRALEARAVLTGTSTFDDPTRPALAVKIDNVPAARPQAGINQADIVYVEEVEGGLTRLAAVFHSQGAEVVGPVRSMRTSDLDLLAQFNGPLFASSGGNRGTQGRLASSSLVDVGVNAQNDLYYRDRSRRAPHNLFTNAFNLWSVGRTLPRAARPSPIFEFRSRALPLSPDAQAVSQVSINYGSSQVSYAWNGSGWDRTQDGEPTVDATGARTSPTTVVVQFVGYVASSADAASPEAVTVGSGDAWVLTDGHLVRTTWSRAGNTAQTDYKTPILPGQIWIELARAGRASAS